VQGNVIGIEHCKPRAAHKGQNAVELPVAQPVLIPGVSLSPERDGPFVTQHEAVPYVEQRPSALGADSAHTVWPRAERW